MGNAYFNELVGGQAMITELFDINPDRVDIVDFPAINRRFLLVKSADGKGSKKRKTEEITMNEVLMSLTKSFRKLDFSSEAVSAFDLIEKAVNDGKVDESAAIGLLNELESAADNDKTVSKSVFDAWLEKATALIDAEETEEVEDEPADEVVVDDATDDEEVEEEAEDSVEEPEGVDESDEPDESVEKSLKEEIRKQALELKAAKEELKKAQEGIDALRIEKQRRDLITKASEELSYLGKSADEIGEVLMSLRTAGVPDNVFKAVYGLLKSNSEMIKQSGLFNEFGTSLDAEDDDDPDAVLMKSAKELVKKGTYETVEKAYVALLREDPSSIESGY